MNKSKDRLKLITKTKNCLENNFNSNIVVNYWQKHSQNDLKNLKSYILEIFDILENRSQDNSDIHITRDPKQYDENRIGSAYWDISKNVCYITSNNLADILRKRMGHAVSVRKVSEELHDFGVLIEDKDKRSVKFRQRRHYLIDYMALKNVCSYLAGDE